MADSAKPQDKALATETSVTSTNAATVSMYTVTNNSTRYLSIYCEGKRMEFTPQSTSPEMQMTEEAAKALSESLQRFPGLIVSPIKKAG